MASALVFAQEEDASNVAGSTQAPVLDREEPRVKKAKKVAPKSNTGKVDAPPVVVVGDGDDPPEQAPRKRRRKGSAAEKTSKVAKSSRRCLATKKTRKVVKRPSSHAGKLNTMAPSSATGGPAGSAPQQNTEEQDLDEQPIFGVAGPTEVEVIDDSDEIAARLGGLMDAESLGLTDAEDDDTTVSGEEDDEVEEERLAPRCVDGALGELDSESDEPLE